MSERQATSVETERRNRRVGVVVACLAAGMLGLSYAAVPLYRIFCQATGLDGSTQRASKPSSTVLERTITVRFDSNVNDLPWTFEPVQRTMVVRVGETALAFYRATNTSDRATTGSAAFNVSPETTGRFFNKLACFCFTEQRLEAHQTVDMPVSFFVDPALVNDKDASAVSEITLSYTFYPVQAPRAAAVPVRPDAGQPAGLQTGRGG